MNVARIILFTNNMAAMSHFYNDILGLALITKDKGWQEFSAGAITLALHSGSPSPGRKGPKIVFQSDDVPTLRQTLIDRGAKFGKARQGDAFCLCDGKDPDGNPIQLSDR
jgi:catechol 2,3-dioxygenase-like lactoylglutathione lyase family enzyme